MAIEIIHNPDKAHKIMNFVRYQESDKYTDTIMLVKDDGRALVRMERNKSAKGAWVEITMHSTAPAQEDLLKRMMNAIEKQAIAVPDVNELNIFIEPKHHETLVTIGWKPNKMPHTGKDGKIGMYKDLNQSYPNKERERVSIVDLGFKVRTLNILKDSGIENLHQLLRVSKDSLRKMKHCGEKTIEDVQQFFDKNGYEWGHEKLVRKDASWWRGWQLEGDVEDEII